MSRWLCLEKTLLTCGLVFLAPQNVLSAQSVQGMIFAEGSGLPLQGASIDVFDARLAAAARAVSDATGRYALALPDTGYFLVAASLGGFATSAPEQIWVGPGEAVTVMLSLREMGGDSIRVVAREGEREGRFAYVYGQVVDNDGSRPITSVDVQVVGGDAAGTMTNGDGRFSIRDAQPGTVLVRFEHLSYAPREIQIDLQPGLAYEVSVRLDPDPLELAGIEVATRSRFVARRLEPVYDRMGGAVSAHFRTERDFEVRGNPPVGTMLRGLPSVRVQNRGPNWGVTMGGAVGLDGGRCVPSIYLDGMRVASSADPSGMSEFLSMSTFDVAVIEVYTGPASLPPEFNDPGTLCAVGIWTRRGG